MVGYQSPEEYKPRCEECATIMVQKFEVHPRDKKRDIPASQCKNIVEF